MYRRIFLCILWLFQAFCPYIVQAAAAPASVYNSIEFKGIAVNSSNPFAFDMIVEPNEAMPDYQVRQQSLTLAKYFLGSLAIPSKDMWVNLSPYEKERIVPPVLGQTVLGLDMLSQDYELKQISAQLLNPETSTGKEFWKKARAKAKALYGVEDLPLNTFNKVWIVPDKATVYERKSKDGVEAFIVDRYLKVMLDHDYKALAKNEQYTTGPVPAAPSQSSELGKLALPVERAPASGPPVDSDVVSQEIMREVIVPILEDEINHGQKFSVLRQIYDAMILSTWYKRKLKDTAMAQVYMNKSKVQGVDTVDSKEAVNKVYQNYVRSFKKGVFNFIKEEPNSRGEVIPRKYFSGGLGPVTDKALTVINQVPQLLQHRMPTVKAQRVHVENKDSDSAMTQSHGESNTTQKKDLGVFLPASDFEGFRFEDKETRNMILDRIPLVEIHEESVNKAFWLTLSKRKNKYVLGVVVVYDHPKVGVKGQASYVYGFKLGNDEKLAKEYYQDLVEDTQWTDGLKTVITSGLMIIENAGDPDNETVHFPVKDFIQQRLDSYFGKDRAQLTSPEQVERMKSLLPEVMRFLRRYKDMKEANLDEWAKIARVYNKIYEVLPEKLQEIVSNQNQFMFDILTRWYGENEVRRHPMFLLEAVTIFLLDVANQPYQEDGDIQELRKLWLEMIDAYNVSYQAFNTQPSTAPQRPMYFGAMDSNMMLMISLAYLVPPDQIDDFNRLSKNCFHLLDYDDQIDMTALSLLFMGIHFSSKYSYQDDEVDFIVIENDLKLMRQAINDPQVSEEVKEQLKLALANLLRAFAEGYKDEKATLKDRFFKALKDNRFTKDEIIQMLDQLKRKESEAQHPMGESNEEYGSIYAGLGSVGFMPSGLKDFYAPATQHALGAFRNRVDYYKDWARYNDWKSKSHRNSSIESAKEFYQQDYAMTNLGGIDLDENKLNLTIQGESSPGLDKAMTIDPTQEIQGLTPYIVHIEPYLNPATASLTSPQ